MVVGGSDGTDLDDVELVSLTEGLEVPECLLDMNPLPHARYLAAGGALQPGKLSKTGCTPTGQKCRFAFLFACGLLNYWAKTVKLH